MGLWARFTARRKVRKAERKAIAARKQHNRLEAQASLARALTLGGGAYVNEYHMSASYQVYHGSNGMHCNPDVSGNCSGMGV